RPASSFDSRDGVLRLVRQRHHNSFYAYYQTFVAEPEFPGYLNRDQLRTIATYLHRDIPNDRDYGLWQGPATVDTIVNMLQEQESFNYAAFLDSVDKVTHSGEFGDIYETHFSGAFGANTIILNSLNPAANRELRRGFTCDGCRQAPLTTEE